ncbi:hypothetical protein GPALN_003665 [Globodera pallida]|nr:hypothetical protein GPALN_003665 [Globodera pallida]
MVYVMIVGVWCEGRGDDDRLNGGGATDAKLIIARKRTKSEEWGKWMGITTNGGGGGEGFVEGKSQPTNGKKQKGSNLKEKSQGKQCFLNLHTYILCFSRNNLKKYLFIKLDCNFRRT